MRCVSRMGFKVGSFDDRVVLIIGSWASSSLVSGRVVSAASCACFPLLPASSASLRLCLRLPLRLPLRKCLPPPTSALIPSPIARPAEADCAPVLQPRLKDPLKRRQSMLWVVETPSRSLEHCSHAAGRSGAQVTRAQKLSALKLPPLAHRDYIAVTRWVGQRALRRFSPRTMDCSEAGSVI